MARPVKWRRIEHIPSVPFFVPSEDGKGGAPENILKLEELEAIRLSDLEGLEQSECARKMEVSRPTFQRILISAREKVADSLVNGKVIKVEGGNFTRQICPVVCASCGKEWNESYENLMTGSDETYVCPACGSENIVCTEDSQGRFCRGNCRRHGRRGRQWNTE